MKKPKAGKTSRFNTAQKILNIPQEQNAKSNGGQALFWIIGVILCAVLFMGIGWFLGQQRESQENYNPYMALKGYEGSRHSFIVKSSEISVKMADRAVAALKRRNIKEAIEDCKTAIDIFPIDSKPYILLTKLYLMTGQERNMFDTLTLAGRSYPNFNNILAMVDDTDLDRMPLEEPAENIYLANFPEDKKSAISFMFDDGEANIYKALPIFDKYGYKATIPVVAGYVSDTSNDPFWGSWAEWKDAASRGFEIANHSMYHRDSIKLHGSDFDISIDQAKDVIEKNIGQKVTAYVFPHDSYSDEAVARALRTHEAIRTQEFLRPYYNRMVDIVLGGPYVSVESANRLVDLGIKRHLWLIAKCHGVTDKISMRSFKSITPEFLDQNLSYIHSKTDDVWVETFSHVFEYLARRKNTTIETTTSGNNSVDFILHAAKPEKLPQPLTVVIKTPAGSTLSSASAAATDGHQLKAWNCETDKICVDVDAYEEGVHLQWH